MMTDASRPALFNAALPAARPPAAWRAALEAAVAAAPALPYVALATVRPSGRPANRTIFFRGFLTASEASTTTSESSLEDEPSVQITSSLDVLRLKSPEKSVGRDSLATIHSDVLPDVLVFVADARSGSVRDILHGSRFGEVCWFMPATKQQFRLSGSLHLVMSPSHPLSIAHQVPQPFADCASSRPDVDWERLRASVWDHISSTRRASFCWPQPGESKLADDAAFPHHLPTIHDLPPLGKTLLAKTDSKIDQIDPVLLQAPRHLVQEPADLASIHSETASPALGSTTNPNKESLTDPSIRHHHANAWSNFCLLLLQVDSVDCLNLAHQPHTRIKYRKECPSVDEDIYLVQSHCKQAERWISKEVNP